MRVGPGNEGGAWERGWGLGTRVGPGNEGGPWNEGGAWELGYIHTTAANIQWIVNLSV